MKKVTPQELVPLAEALKVRPRTLKEIMSVCGISRETAYRWLRILRKQGSYDVVGSGSGPSKLWRVV